jgi:uncharacterized repeat protein (TIGR03803 family)
MTRIKQHRIYISTIHLLNARRELVLGAIFALAVIGTPGQAQTYTVVHSFNGPPTDGKTPAAGLIRDPAGNLYGTTFYGGASDYGAVFKLNKTDETVLHSFTGGADGANPAAGLIRDPAGNLYGTTQWGGIMTGLCSPTGCGVVFRLDPTGKETVLYSFTGGGDGANPAAGVIGDAAGNLYGTTPAGGASGYGVVFKLDKSGESVLYSFTGGADGANPEAALVRDLAGNLYGTTDYGGASRYGVVFKLETTGKETVLHSFSGSSSDGALPYSGRLVPDPAGNLYGTTAIGGTSDWGVVFKLDMTGKETVLYNFTGGADGAGPQAGVIRDSAGNLYGTTWAGGSAEGDRGKGVVFKLDVTGAESVLHSFAGSDGADSGAGLIGDSAGNLYGTTKTGGKGNGVVFTIKP